MFKYTPKASVLRDMEVPKIGRYWDKEFFKRQEILKAHGASQDYTMSMMLSRYFKDVSFFSETKRKEIPVYGHLFPASMFDETKVD
jgi:hypothetical protein